MMILSEILHSWGKGTAATRFLCCVFLLCCVAGPEVLHAATVQLTVRKEGDGVGTVSRNGILCGPDCTTKTFSLPQGASVTLTSSAAEGSIFVGFMGQRCYGKTCTFTLNANTTIYAAFGLPDVLAIRYSRPSNGDTGVGLSDQVNVYFNRDIAEGPNFAEIALKDAEGTPVPFTPVIRSTDRRLVFVQASNFAPGATYMVDVPAGAISDTQGNALDTPYSFTFRTAVTREPQMYIAVYPNYVQEGSATTVSIWFENPASQERTIALSSTPEGELFHASEVILEAGQVLVEVPVDSRYNHGRTSPLAVTFSAADPEVGQRSVQIEVVNNTALYGPYLAWQGAGVVTDTDQDGVFEAGERADIRFDVANMGSATISNVILDFSVITGSGLSILGGAPYCYLGSLAPGRNGNCTKTFAADSELPTSDYYVQVQGTFSVNNIPDSILDQARVPIVNNFQPDFILTAGSFPSAELKPGSVVDMVYTARNSGDGFSARLPLFEVTLEMQGASQLLYRTYANARGHIWSSQSFRLPLTVPPVPGTHTIRARINPPGTGRLTESNYANNDAAVLTLRVAVVYPLTVTIEGNGAGTVTSLPGGIDCVATCSADFISGKVVTLTASPAEGSVLIGWSGAGCSGTGSCVVTMDAARSVTATFEVPGPPSFDLYTVTPCRVYDTRLSAALVSGVLRSIDVAGICRVPITARALVLNVTVVSPSGSGYVSLWPADLSWPGTSVVNFSSGQTRANNAIVGLATDGGGNIAAQALVGGSGTVHLVLDVSGYFE